MGRTIAVLAAISLAAAGITVAVLRGDLGSNRVEFGDGGPRPDLSGGGLMRQRGAVVGHVRAMGPCTEHPQWHEGCARQRYPVTRVALRDVRRHGLDVTVPRAGHLEVRALRDRRPLRGWTHALQVIDYGAIERYRLWARRGLRPGPLPRRADGVRFVAFAGDEARGFDVVFAPPGGASGG